MQRRERILMLAVGVLAGGWLLDGAVIGPALSWYDGVRVTAQKAHEEAAQSQALVDRQSRIMTDWRRRHAAGLLDDEATARFRMQSALAEAARSGGVTLDNVGGGQLVPATRDETCDTLRLTATGQGSLAQVMGFLRSLQASPQPLRIERSELSASDARKDQIDLSLTVSTRLVPTKARSGRGVPDGTPAWTGETVDPAPGEAVVAAKPFLAERRGGARTASADTKPIATPAAAGGWALVGIVVRDSTTTAFMRHLGDGSERSLAVGEEIDGHVASAVDADGVVLGTGDEAKRIAVGTQLDGTPVPATSGQRPVASSPRPAASGQQPAASTPAASPPLSDPGREAILERLRQQRNRTP